MARLNLSFCGTFRREGESLPLQGRYRVSREHSVAPCRGAIGDCRESRLCYIAPASFSGESILMATKDDHYTPGAMDISQHQRTYAGFLAFGKYSLGFII